MLEPGRGFFALWNGIAPDQAEAFALMHARDHLAEHLASLGPDGILWARRHGDGVGTLPPFFTLYGMTSLDLLTDPAHAGATVHETALFRAIRPSYRDRIAHHCRVLASAGGGVGGAAGTFIVSLAPAADARPDDAARLADALTRLEFVTAAHIGVVDWTKPARVGTPLPEPPPDGAAPLAVVAVESFSRFGLAASMAALSGLLLGSGVVSAVHGSGHYAFSYGLDQAALASLRHFRRDTRP